jgi:hypothetical protein
MALRFIKLRCALLEHHQWLVRYPARERGGGKVAE